MELHSNTLLEPCAFCGKKVKLIYELGRPLIHCNKCHFYVSGDDYLAGFGADFETEKLVESWNNRKRTANDIEAEKEFILKLKNGRMICLES